MFKSILMKLGFFLFELGSNVLIKIMLGSEVTKELERLVEQLQSEDLTSKQKYNRAKKFLDSATDGLPDLAKNVAIETVVSKIAGKSEKIMKAIKEIL